MLIGRADDPQSPRRVVARRGRRSVWEGIAEPIWASGHVPHKQAGHTDALAPGSDIFSQDTLQRRGRPHTPYEAPYGKLTEAASGPLAPCTTPIRTDCPSVSVVSPERSSAVA